MAKFNVGDIIYKNESGVPYTVQDIDYVSGPMPKYKLVDGNFKFWDYCIGWKKVVTEDDVLRYGNVLTDDELHYELKGYVTICPIHKRIRTISYDNRIFYHKMVNGEVVEFKELTV